MSRIKIDAVVVPLSGHLYPVLLLLAPLLHDPNYEIRIFTGPQKQKVVEDMGFTVVPIMKDQVDFFDKISTNHRQLNLLTALQWKHLLAHLAFLQGWEVRKLGLIN